MRPRRPTALIALALAGSAAGAHASAISRAKTGHAAAEKPFTLFGSNLIGSLVVEPTRGKTGETIPGLPFHFGFTAPNLPAVGHSVTSPFQGSGPGTVAGQYEALSNLVKHPTIHTTPAPAKPTHAQPSPFPWLPTPLKNAPSFAPVTSTTQSEPVAEAQVVVVPEPSPLALAALVLAGLALRRRVRTGAKAGTIR